MSKSRWMVADSHPTAHRVVVRSERRLPRRIPVLGVVREGAVEAPSR